HSSLHHIVCSVLSHTNAQPITQAEYRPDESPPQKSHAPRTCGRPPHQTGLGSADCASGASRGQRSKFGWCGRSPVYTLELREPKDRKSTRLNSSHASTSYAVLC